MDTHRSDSFTWSGGHDSLVWQSQFHYELVPWLKNRARRGSMSSLLGRLVHLEKQYIFNKLGVLCVSQNTRSVQKGYGVYLDALHKDHLEVIDKTGNVKYVLNLDGTLNPDKTKKALGRVVKGWK